VNQSREYVSEHLSTKTVQTIRRRQYHMLMLSMPDEGPSKNI